MVVKPRNKNKTFGRYKNSRPNLASNNDKGGTNQINFSSQLNFFDFIWNLFDFLVRQGYGIIGSIRSAVSKKIR